MRFQSAAMARSSLVVAIATIAATLALGTITLLAILINRLSPSQKSLHGLAISSITFQSLSTILIIRLTAETQRQRFDGVITFSIGLSSRRVSLFSSLVLSAIAAIMTLATIVRTKVEINGIENLILGRRPWVILLAVLITWISSLLTQIALYWMIYQRQKNLVDQEAMTGQYPATRTASAMTDANELDLVPVRRRLSQGLQETSSPPLTPRTANGKMSLRSSLTLAVRPSTSKTKLLSYQPAYFRNSTATTSTMSRLNSSSHSQDSGLDSWDTSSVTPTIRETVLRSSQPPNNIAALPPIPGSRSPSPANILQDFTLPPSSASASLPASPVLGPQHNFSRPCVRQRSASVESLYLAERSSSIAEEHIHPLFRTYSPNPAPSATPGTNVTAAPGSFEGLLINERSLHKMRSERSLPSNRSIHSPSSAGPSSPLVRSSPMSFPHEEAGDAIDQAGRREEDP